MNLFKLNVIRCALALLKSLPELECRTCGTIYGTEEFHCLTCTIHDIRERLERAVALWEKNDNWKKVPS